MKYNKLVRDKIPDMIIEEGYIPKTKILSHKEYLHELDKKLGEEVREYRQSKEIEELADILEVIYAICEARGYAADELMEIKDKKQQKRGGFSKKIFLISKSKER